MRKPAEQLETDYTCDYAQCYKLLLFSQPSQWYLFCSWNNKFTRLCGITIPIGFGKVTSPHIISAAIYMQPNTLTNFP